MIAGILSITGSDDEIRPIAFYSRTLTAPELNYHTHNMELLAIFEAFKSWRHYLEGPALPIDIVTDHKNLEYFLPLRFSPIGKPTGQNISHLST